MSTYPYRIPRTFDALAELIRTNGRRSPSTTLFVYLYLSIAGEDYIESIYRAYRNFIRDYNLNIKPPTYKSFRILIHLLRRAGLVVNTHTQEHSPYLAPRQYIALSDKGKELTPEWFNIYGYNKKYGLPHSTTKQEEQKEEHEEKKEEAKPKAEKKQKKKRQKKTKKRKAKKEEKTVEEKEVARKERRKPSYFPVNDETSMMRALKITYSQEELDKVSFDTILRKMCNGEQLNSLEVNAILNPSNVDPETYVYILFLARKLSEEHSYYGLLWSTVIDSFQTNEKIKSLLSRYMEEHGYDDIYYLETEADYIERDDICGGL